MGRGQKRGEREGVEKEREGGEGIKERREGG